MSDLPLIIAEIERIAGSEAALELAMAKGGQEIYVPVAATDDHWLTRAVGLEAARKICDHYRGSRIIIPMAKLSMQRRRLIAALKDGASAAEASAAAGMHIRSAYRARKNHKDDRQGTLF